MTASTSADPDVAAAAALIIDTLRVNRTYLLIPNDARVATRAVQSTLDYFAIVGDKLAALLRVLIDAGEVKAFFNMAIPKNDTGLKDYLLANGVYWETVLLYHDFDTWDGLEFGRGFVMGVGASFLAILEALWDLFAFSLDALTGPVALHDQLIKLLDGLKGLSPNAIKTFAGKEWDLWNQGFSQALFDLRFDKAGYMLGKLGGDLWQLATGVTALAKLPGLTLQAARGFAEIFAAGARASRTAIELLAELLVKVAASLDEAALIGYGAVSDFADDATVFLKQLKAGAVAVVDDLGRTIFAIPDDGLALAGGQRIDGGFLLAESNGQVVASTRVEFDTAWRYIEALLPTISKDVKRVRLSAAFWKEISKAQKLADEFLEIWRETLIVALKDKEKLPLNAREFGSWIHDHMEVAFANLAEAMGVHYQARAEIRISALAEELAVSSAEAKRFAQRAQTPLLKFVKERPALMKTLGVADEEELLDYLKRIGGYENPAESTIGRLQSDGVLFNRETKTAMSVDWTSGWSKIGFANEYERILKAGGTLSEAEKLALARQFLTHSYREYALREAILEYVLEGWQTKVLEVLYRALEAEK